MIGDTSTWLECNKAMLEYIHPQYLRDEIDVSLNFKSCNEIRSHYVIGTCTVYAKQDSCNISCSSG